ncbi:MAG: hypothetical protein LBD03_08500 [Methanobrevibacter sp.]|nr:hypothetical protein [Candidatus Methanovirga procula]
MVIELQGHYCKSCHRKILSTYFQRKNTEESDENMGKSDDLTENIEDKIVNNGIKCKVRDLIQKISISLRNAVWTLRSFLNI